MARQFSDVVADIASQMLLKKVASRSGQIQMPQQSAGQGENAPIMNGPDGMWAKLLGNHGSIFKNVPRATEQPNGGNDMPASQMLMERPQPLIAQPTFTTRAQPTAPQFLATPQEGISPDYQGEAVQNGLMQNQMEQGPYDTQLQGLYDLEGLLNNNAENTRRGSWKWGS